MAAVGKCRNKSSAKYLVSALSQYSHILHFPTTAIIFRLIMVVVGKHKLWESEEYGSDGKGQNMVVMGKCRLWAGVGKCRIWAAVGRHRIW